MRALTRFTLSHPSTTSKGPPFKGEQPRFAVDLASPLPSVPRAQRPKVDTDVENADKRRGSSV